MLPVYNVIYIPPLYVLSLWSGSGPKVANTRLLTQGVRQNVQLMALFKKVCFQNGESK